MDIVEIKSNELLMKMKEDRINVALKYHWKSKTSCPLRTHKHFIHRFSSLIQAAYSCPMWIGCWLLQGGSVCEEIGETRWLPLFRQGVCWVWVGRDPLKQWVSVPQPQGWPVLELNHQLKVQKPNYHRCLLCTASAAGYLRELKLQLWGIHQPYLVLCQWTYQPQPWH